MSIKYWLIVVPMVVTAVTIMIEITLAIIAYSIAVAPRASPTKDRAASV
jgi:hypothetical protein